MPPTALKNRNPRSHQHKSLLTLQQRNLRTPHKMSLPFKNKYLHSSIQTRLTVTIMDSYILQHSPMISLKPQQSEKYPRHRLTSPQPDSLQPPNPFSDLLCSISNPQNRHRTWQKLHSVYQKKKLPLALPRPRSRPKPKKHLEILVKNLELIYHHVII